MIKIKRISALLTATVLVLALCGCAVVGSKTALEVNILNNGVYYSELFKAERTKISVSSNMDCAIEIVNVDDETDVVSIGYLTPGMCEKIELKNGESYRIKSDLTDTDALEITMTGISQ